MPPRPRHPAPVPASGAGTAGAQDREIEWQLAAPDLGVVQRWLGQHPALDQLGITALPAQQLHDIYLDTGDWRLFRAGFALRLRDSEGRIEATLKGLSSARDDVADRREISEQMSKSGLEGVKALAHATGPVGSRVRDVAGVEPLHPLFEVRTSRQRFAVRSRDSAAAVGEIALDEARFPRANGHRRPILLTRVELEAAGSDTAPLERLAHRLSTECGLHPATESKFAVGLRSASLEPRRPGPWGEQAEPPQAAMDASTRIGEFAAATLRRLLRDWQAHEPAARLGESPEALHALRVTGRRMDTVISLFEAHLPGGVGKSRPTLKDLLDTLGAVRDADIRLELAARFRGTLPDGSRRALDPLLRQLESERAEARSALLRALDATPARRWIETLPDQLARAAPARSASRNASALSAVPDLMSGRYRKLRQCASRLSAESPLAEYHKVRVRTKKLRYALEIATPTYGKPADDLLAALHKLQSRLGTQHDAAAMEEYLTRLATHPPAGFTPETLFVMGRMAQMHAREAARLRRKIDKPWRKARGKHWKALRSRMKELRPDAQRA